jgi:hypothetical protein
LQIKHPATCPSGVATLLLAQSDSEATPENV